MRVLMMVQQLDETNWLRGFTVGWIRAMARQVDEVQVIALENNGAEFPVNVHVQSMGKEKGYSRPRELFEFYRALARVIGKVDVLFSHMTPLYTVLAAPFAIPYRKPQMVWFTHRQVTPELRLALAVSRWATTATHDSFGLKSPKLHVTGHGIDTQLFSPGNNISPDHPPLILAVGRISPIKHHHILLEAAVRLRDHHGNPNVRFAVAGRPASPGDDEYYASLLQKRADLGLSEEQFQFLGAMPQQELIGWYRRASVVTNLSPAGLFDKAALEAMLTATPTLVSNPAFDDLLGNYTDLLRVDSPEDIEGIAQKLNGILSLAPEAQKQIGSELRKRTASAHGLDELMVKLVRIMQT